MIIDGNKIAEKILLGLKEKIRRKNLKLKLAVVLVGDDYASRVYVRRKKEAAEKVGIGFELFHFPEDIPEEELKSRIRQIALDLQVSGIIVQLPLPKNFDAGNVLEVIPPEKNAESISPVISAVQEIFKEYDIRPKNKKIVLVGKGKLVGGPLAKWLESEGLNYGGKEKIKEADIVISGVGKPKIITGDMIKKGAVVIDIGFSHDENKKAVGDVDFEKVSQKASLVTPVPGGVGPITVACLLKNLVKLKK